MAGRSRESEVRRLTSTQESDNFAREADVRPRGLLQGRDAMGFSTDAIHIGQEPDPATGAIIVPIYQTSTFVQAELGKHKGYEYARTFLKSLRLCSLAESLGGVETLVAHPATMTHSSVPPEERRRLGITDGLLRISVGIKDVEDLIADLQQALDRLE